MRKIKVLIINGNNKKGTTNLIARTLAENISDDITQYFLPRDFNHNCLECWTCYNTTLDKCPHWQDLEKIYNSIIESDILIFASPVYVYHTTGAMKNFLDHFGVKWIVHRPEEIMFKKCAVCISTAAGAGMKSTIKDMKDSLSFWGVPKIYSLGFAVYASRPDNVRKDISDKFIKKANKLARKIRKRNFDKPRANLRAKFFFVLMKIMHKKGKFGFEADNKYWKEKGWHDKKNHGGNV